MTAVWHQDVSRWKLLAPAGFPDEAALHALVEQAPQLLPLAGTPQLVILGREVLLGGNYADLIAMESTGRLVVIEIKLARNAEARRAVIAQILTYAAYLRGLDPRVLEQDILGSHLTTRGYGTLVEAVTANDQTGSLDPDLFADQLRATLRDGRFRLVLVLDQAPEELVRLVGYLQAVADRLVIDLVTVAAYAVAGSQVIVPQRVDPEREGAREVAKPRSPAGAEGRLVHGADDFVAAIEEAPADQRPLLHRLTAWAKGLERDELATLSTYLGKGNIITLLPRLRADNVGLVTIYNRRSPNGTYLQFWRGVIERRAPASLARIEQCAAPAKVGQGNNTREISDDLLDALTTAYQEAATGQLWV